MKLCRHFVVSSISDIQPGSPSLFVGRQVVGGVIGGVTGGVTGGVIGGVTGGSDGVGGRQVSGQLGPQFCGQSGIVGVSHGGVQYHSSGSTQA